VSSHLHPGSKMAPPENATEVSNGIYAYVQPDGSWWINNTGFMVGSNAVVSVDACSTTNRTRAYLGAIARVTDLPVRTLVNTHHHGDHTFGNYLFGGATIVGHDGVRQALLDWGLPHSAPYWNEVDWGEVELAPPFLTYTEQIKIYVDDLACEVSHVGTPAHTTNDSIVWVPERRLLFSGDLVFNGGTPFMLQGSIAGALTALAKIKALGAETVVPGHGPVCGPEIIDTMTSYLRFVQDVANRGQEAGLSPLEAARETDLGDFAGLLDSERIVGNLHRAYAETPGTALGVKIDAGAALADMVTYNGGQPLSCYA
jgi:cyclase